MFRRRKAETDPDESVEAPVGDLEAESSTPDVRAAGPWDASEVEIDEDDENRVDLGGLVLTAREGLEIQLQVDEGSGEVAAVLIAGEEGAAELRAFAAPRHGDVWAEVRKGLAGEIAQMGGTATESEGPFGAQLEVSLMVDLPDGSSAQQPSTVWGISGPRWLLRVTLFGRPAVAYDEDGDVESAVRDVVVVRGTGPIPPQDPLPLTVPSTAQRIE